MAKSKPRSPKELAKANQPRRTYSFSLDETNVEFLKKQADELGIHYSRLIDEAISFYIEKTKIKS